MKQRGGLWLILIVALALRLVYSFGLDAQAPYDDRGGDSGWYLANAYTLVTGDNRSDIVIDVSRLPTAPLYLLFIGFWQALLSPEGAIIAIRISQALMSTATCYFVYRLSTSLGGERAGLIAAGAAALSPAFVIESAQILTETLYMFLLVLGMWIYSIHLQAPGKNQPVIVLAIAGLVLGVATLTRAVLLLFPLGLVLHLILVHGWRRGLINAAALLTAFILIVSTWTAYNKLRWDRWVIGAEGMAAFLYVGAREEGWNGPKQVDESLLGQVTEEDIAAGTVRTNQDDYAEGAVAIISSDIGGYVQRRVAEMLGAQLQPHGTTFFPGESLKNLLATWLADDRTLDGLIRLMSGDAFWPKLAIYAFHFVGILGGLTGMWLTRRQWRISLPLIGYILYTALIHLALTALPRYIFPTQLFWWVFAGVAVSVLVRLLAQGRYPGKDRSSSTERAIDNQVGIIEDSARIESRR